MATNESTANPVYSTEQVEAWLEHIGLPKDFRPEHVPGKDLEALARIQTYHLSKVPFENVEAHYTKHHAISLDPETLYKRIVIRGHGGYCMQGNSFLEQMLRAVGYTVYSAGARSRPRANGIPTGPWMGWTHQVIIATLADGHKYLVDVAYGGDCPVVPMRLEQGIVNRNLAIHTRLALETHGCDKSQKTWIYQIQYAPGGEWYGAFCFKEVEFLPQDFAVMNYFTSTHSSSWLSTTVMGVRFIREGEKIVGKYTIAGKTIRKNIEGNVTVIQECQNEQERVAGLEKYLGIVLNEEEWAAIRGRPAELKST